MLLLTLATREILSRGMVGGQSFKCELIGASNKGGKPARVRIVESTAAHPGIDLQVIR